VTARRSTAQSLHPAPDVAGIAKRVESSTGELARHAMTKMQDALPWFGAMPPEQRSLVGLIVQSGLRGFAEWLGNPTEGMRIGGEVFATAPGEMARIVTLEQTVELVRIAVEVAEAHVADLATPADHAWLREATLRYSREIAFSVAMVYARAAEQRGAWDARLESLVVDAVVRGAVDDALLTRAAALGWVQPASVFVIAGSAPPGDPEPVIAALHDRGRSVGAELLGGVQASRLVALVGTDRRRARVVRGLLPVFGPGPVVIGPAVTALAQAAESARSALSGLRVVAAWPGAPRPVESDDLLPERVLGGDADATAQLIATVWTPLSLEPTLMETATAYIEGGGSIEATARTLWVHPNTVRYRISRIETLSGRNLTESRDYFAVSIALGLGRLNGGL